MVVGVVVRKEITLDNSFKRRRQLAPRRMSNVIIITHSNEYGGGYLRQLFLGSRIGARTSYDRTPVPWTMTPSVFPQKHHVRTSLSWPLKRTRLCLVIEPSLTRSLILLQHPIATIELVWRSPRRQHQSSTRLLLSRQLRHRDKFSVHTTEI